jgi:hypothetical protein
MKTELSIKNRGADSQSAAPALLPLHGGRAQKRIETSLDPAGKSACATLALVAFLLGAAAALAQPAITPPAMGIVRDSSGSLHTMLGVPGNFVALDDIGISNAVSAAFSGSAGLVKTDSELLVLDAAGQIANRYDAPPDRALLAFDRRGAPALVYYSGTLLRFDNNELKPVNWTGDAISIGMVGPQSAVVVLRRGDQLWSVRITLATGDVESETAIVDAASPLFLLPDAGLLFTRDNNIVVRDSNGVERLAPAGFEVDFFEAMGRDWIAVRETAGGRLFALRIAPQSLDLYQLPEVTQ